MKINIIYHLLTIILKIGRPVVKICMQKNNDHLPMISSSLTGGLRLIQVDFKILSVSSSESSDSDILLNAFFNDFFYLISCEQ